MKKLYISCPTKYRKQEDINKTIEKLHKIAEIQFDEKLEVINEPGDEKNDLKELAEHLTKMAEADYVIGIDMCGIYDISKTCFNEMQKARDYDKPCIWMDSEHVAPDLTEVCNKIHNRHRRF